MERIHQKIGRIKEHLSMIRSIKGDCLNRFTTDPIYRGAVAIRRWKITINSSDITGYYRNFHFKFFGVRALNYSRRLKPEGMSYIP
jgi:hypothetical protein